MPGDASNEITPTPCLATRFNEWWARFIPQSPPQWVAYQSDESGQYQIYVDSYPTSGNRQQISTSGGQYPHWSPDGRELFYLSQDFMLMSITVASPGRPADMAPKPLFRLPAIDTGRDPYQVSPDGQRFLVRAVPAGATHTMSAIVNWPSLVRSGSR